MDNTNDNESFWHEAYCSVGEAFGDREPECAAPEYYAEKVKELLQENRALREDKKRLDWIDANRPALDRWRNQFFVASGFTRQGHDNIRDAIDQARNARP